MNTNNDELERMLGRQLHDQVDGMGGHPLGLGDVLGRAGRIRRNRRIAGGVGVAAAVAIIAPVAMFAAQGLNGADPELDPAPSPDAPVEIARTTLTLDGLDRGDAPGVEYFTPDGVVLPGEGLQELDVSYQALVPSQADGGWIAVEPDGQGVRYLGEGFEPRGGSSTADGLATTPDRSWATWSAREPGVQSLVLHSTTDPEAGMVWDLTELPPVQPVDFVSEGSVVYETTDQEGGETDVFIVARDGSTTELTGFVGARAANPVNGLVAVQTRTNADASGCFGVVDPEVSSSEPVWETCDHSLGAFSPDGRYVMASSPYGDGLGLTELAVLDAETGEMVARFTQASNTRISLVMPVWESADTIVAVGFEGETQTLVRLGVDGSLEETVDPVEGLYGDLYFYLGEDRTRL